MQILYLYKIILHVVPNAGFVWNYCPRNKLHITPKTSRKQGWAHSLRNASFSVTGPNLFNSLPAALRELPDLSKTTKSLIRCFKENVDLYLECIPDLPGTANSILDHQNIDYSHVRWKTVKNSNKENNESNNNTITNTDKNKRRRSRKYGRLADVNMDNILRSRWDNC